MFTCAMEHAASAYAAWMLSGAPEAGQQILTPSRHAHCAAGLFSSFNQRVAGRDLVEQGRCGGAASHRLELARARQQDWVGGAMAYRAAYKLAAMAGDKPRARRCLTWPYRPAAAARATRRL